MKDDKIHKIGDPIEGEPPSVFELVIEDHVAFVDPQDFGLTEEFVDPNHYFVTSGDAVEKAKVLEKDIWKLAGDLRKRSYQKIEKQHKCTSTEAQAKFRDGIRPRKPLRFSDYEAAVWKAAGQARKLTNLLRKTKGENCFLETEWDNHRLLCIPKNPRNP